MKLPESAATTPPDEKLAALTEVLAGMGRIAVAVSGGVDSLTLATAASRLLGGSTEMFHAVSPAVPAEATQRVRLLAAREGWRLTVLDAGEFQDEDYRRNPANRCFYCKTRLYGAMRARTSAQLVSGTNLDDLGEYRPGLQAASDHGVRHPYVEAGLDKSAVRAFARKLGLGEVAELPAAPCLASRIETGIAIQAQVLGLIHEVEKTVAAALSPRTVRCRVRANGIVIELDGKSLSSLGPARRERLRAQIHSLCEAAAVSAPVSFGTYLAGSAFLRPVQDEHEQR